jgi:hypothetical protein
MKYLVLILFCIFVQTDTVKVDSVVAQDIQQKIDNTNSKLDSIIAILRDTIK